MTRGTKLGGAALVAALVTMTNAWAAGITKSELADHKDIPAHPFRGTYLGGAGNDSVRGIAVDDSGGLYVTGNGFVAKYGPDLHPQWSFTVLGQGEGIALVEVYELPEN